MNEGPLQERHVSTSPSHSLQEALASPEPQIV